MEQNGVPLRLLPEEFPFRQAIAREQIHEELHLVIPKEHMLQHVRTWADFNSSRIAYNHIAALGFIAEACKNTMTYRGHLRPKLDIPSMDGTICSRITVIMTYIPKRTHHENNEALSPEEILADDNIAAYMFSILVLDPELHLAYALSDQVDINNYGEPSFRKKDEIDDAVQVPGPEPPLDHAAAPAQGNFDGPNAFEDDSSIDSEASDDADAMQVNAVQPAAPAADNGNHNIDADTYRPLDTFGSRFWYPGKHGIVFNKPAPKKSKLASEKLKQDPNIHKCIRNTEGYADYIVESVCLLPTTNKNVSRSSFCIADIREDDPMHFKNCLSLEAAVERLAELGAAPLFRQRHLWRDDANGFCVPGDELHVAAELRIQNFNTHDLFKYCMPHCQIIDRNRILPIGETNVEEFITLKDGTRRNLNDMQKRDGIRLAYEVQEELESENQRFDVWQLYFDRFRSVEIDLQEQVRKADFGMHGLPPELLTRLKLFREQGFQHFASMNHLQNRFLPDGNKALLKFRIKTGDVLVPIMHLYQPLNPRTMAPFAQFRANEVMFASDVLKVTDYMVILFPKLILATTMVWLPFMDGATNREHIQCIGPPGSSKSDTLNRSTSQLIEGTFIFKSGGSKKGVLGPHRSQRLIEVYHELNSLLAPSKDPTAGDQDVVEMKLTQLSEGLYIYETTIEDPLTGERVDSRKISHYTNNIFGAKNPGQMRLSRDGPAAAMIDRNTRVKVIPTAAPGRQTISERIFQNFMTASKDTKLPHEMFRVMQLSVAEYCCLMSCYAVPLPNIELFSNIAPNAIGYLATMHPELANRLRDIGRIKTRLYAEQLTDAARIGVCSAIGLAGRALRDGKPYVYDTNEVVREMSKYMYTSYEQMVFVLSSSVYDMSEGQYNAIAATFVMETTEYIPMGRGPEGTGPQYAEPYRWPDQDQELDQPARDNAQAALIAAKDTDFKFFSLKRILEHVLANGKNYLGTPGKAEKDGPLRDQPYILREHLRVNRPNSDSESQYAHRGRGPEYDLDLDLFSVVAGITNDNPEPPRLDRSYDCKTQFKTETIAGNTYINFNYVRINGTPDAYANSFSSTVGNHVMTSATIKDVLYTLSRTKVIVPYLPVIPEQDRLVTLKPGYIQSLRHSYTALRSFKLYNVPVLIIDNNRMYLLASYAETNPELVIQKMVEHMCYEGTRTTNSVIGIPSHANSLDYRPVEIASRPGVSIKVARKSNLSEVNFKRLQKQFGADVFGEDRFTKEGDGVYKEIDLEEQIALRAILYAHPEMTVELAREYTPRGIWNRFYGPEGVYRPGNPFTVNDLFVENQQQPVPNEPQLKRKPEQPRHSAKRVQQEKIPGIDMTPQRYRSSNYELFDV